MYVRRRFTLSILFSTLLPRLAISGPWALIVYVLYSWGGLTLLRLPFLPISTIGIAVSFYVGFKNNSAYDRFWEGRKIWGGIVNASRTWANAVLTYVPAGKAEARRELLYRHLAWINALRMQLRKTSRFLEPNTARTTKRRMRLHANHMRMDWSAELRPFLSASELAEVTARANPATQLLRAQAERLRELHGAGALDLFHQIDLMGVIKELYGLQGKAERIKHTPFPRMYANTSRMFTKVFVTLVPMGLLDVFGANHRLTEITWDGVWPVLPMIVCSVFIAWVFNLMEGIGDATEDPFERSISDVPMNALCRTIEIDVREMLGETELPEREVAIDNILY